MSTDRNSSKSNQKDTTRSPSLFSRLQSNFPPPSISRRDNYHWFVVTTVCVGAFMAALDASIVNIALPVLQRQFHTTFSTITWISLTYLLTLAALIIPFGRLADMFGRKWMYAFGFSVFIVGSLLCGLSPSLPYLLAARVLQAIGAGMLQANSVSIITAATPARDRGKAIGIQGAAQAVGLSLGPAIGGLLLSFAGWRWIFFVNIPVGLIGTTLGILLLPQDSRSSTLSRFDFLGTALLAPALVGLMYALNAGHDAGWGSPLVIGAFCVSAVGLALFLVAERRASHPLVDLKLFHIPEISMGTITGVLSFAVMYAVTLLGPFYFDHVMNLKSYQAGLYLTAIPIGMTICTPFAGAMADRLGTRLLTASGMAIAGAGGGLLAISTFFPHHGGAIGIAAGFVLIGAGVGVFTPPNNSSVMGHSPQNRLGVAGGLLNMARTMGMGFGVVVGQVSYQLFLTFQGASQNPAVAQMIPAFRDAFLSVVFIALLTLVLSAVKIRSSADA